MVYLRELQNAKNLHGIFLSALWVRNARSIMTKARVKDEI